MYKFIVHVLEGPKQDNQSSSLNVHKLNNYLHISQLELNFWFVWYSMNLCMPCMVYSCMFLLPQGHVNTCMTDSLIRLV